MGIKQKEYGGCLYFESAMENGRECYEAYKEHKLDVDSGRSALQYIVENYGFKRIWLPVYNCPLVAHRIKETSDINILWYNIKNDFFPQIELDDLEEGDCLLWVNYCGIMAQTTIDKIVQLQVITPAKIIIDNIPAYFSTPHMEAINIYSCRKFIGVPDGGHIIGNVVVPTQLPTYSTAENYVYLLKAIETGSNSAYDGYNKSERRFRDAKTAYGMPLLTKKILQGVDYEAIKRRRKNNFMILHDVLGGRNRLQINSSTDTPLVYPYLCTNIVLRQRLIDNKIYISRFWKHVLTNELANSFEKDLAEYLIPLPIDQRYGIEDMHYLAYIVDKLEKNQR